ncbi:hypothetical protein PYW07_017320 [Mythimna separata]|uniref:Uncharacterized protein n=1 Tax=Mythimna separata TaxID=271217 RepID=A0AAD7YXV8_MYTSE|nr:hypothetical protein PYW07_017320 [Mythimna separata]
MDLCRICLTGGSEKDIFQSQSANNVDNKSLADVFMFCLDIQVEQDSKISTKLCLKCYKKILSFHEFKILALKNDAYLKSVQEESGVKNEVFLRDEVKNEQDLTLSVECDDSLDIINVKDEPKDELDLKNEDSTHDYESDDEFLSVIKNIKYEFERENEEKAPVKRKRKKGIKSTPGVKREKERKPAKQMCEECGKTVKDLRTHSFQHMPVASRKRIKCKLCDKVFSSHSARYKHNKIKHLGIKQECVLCNKMVTSLRQHHRLMHNRAALQYECVLCGRRFISKSVLDLHMTTHTKDRPYSCTECDKKFSTKQRVQIHKRAVHDKEKSHLCQLCSKSFFKKYHLQLHLRSHSKEKPCECPECGKFFSTTSILKSHREIHKEEKSYACTLCDMTFKKKNYLNVHMISHTKEKRHACQYCGIKFGRSDHRKRHEYTAHEKNFVTA